MLLTTVTDTKSIADGLSDIKDILTCFGIGLTLLFGLVAIYQKIHDKRIALRKQLTDLLEKLAQLNLDLAKYEKDKATSDSLPENYIGLANDFRRFYVEQAANIATQLPKNKTSAHENTLIAMAFNNVDDIGNAKTFFENAIERAKTVPEKFLSERNYARFVFQRINVKDGEAKFEAIFNLFQKNDDIYIRYRGETYKRWASLYRSSDPDRFIFIMNQALKEYSRLKGDNVKRSIENIQKSIAEIKATKADDKSNRL